MPRRVTEIKAADGGPDQIGLMVRANLQAAMDQLDQRELDRIAEIRSMSKPTPEVIDEARSIREHRRERAASEKKLERKDAKRAARRKAEIARARASMSSAAFQEWMVASTTRYIAKKVRRFELATIPMWVAAGVGPVLHDPTPVLEATGRRGKDTTEGDPANEPRRSGTVPQTADSDPAPEPRPRRRRRFYAFSTPGYLFDDDDD